MYKFLASLFCAICFSGPLIAQSLSISTVTRPPFSLVQDDKDVGFSIELWEAIAKDLGTDFTIKRHENFSDMLQAVQNGESDAAVANISITAAREATMDFSHPIFSSGLRTMIPLNPETKFSIFRTILSWEILLAVLGAFAVLLAVGMLMWRFERDEQEYFDKPARQAIFPAFWWELNLVVNGGLKSVHRAARWVVSLA